MTLTDSDIAIARMRAEADQHRAEVLDARRGESVTAPRGGEPCIVAAVFGDESRLVSHDGGMPRDGEWCTHDAPNAMYFEYVGGDNDGSHGWYDAHDSCMRVFQWG
jgi:hypothetical protein